MDVAYEQAGPPGGTPVVLLHGFPYDVRAFDEVAPLLAARNALVFAPFLRGFGATSFREESTMRSGQQAALGHDLVEFMDALGIGSAVLAGYDWGGRAACITAALHPERVRGLATVDGYPDFVDVVIHSYRHRFGLVEGDSRYRWTEELLAGQPPITVPAVMLETGADGLLGPSSSGDRAHFTGPYEHRLLQGVGHNPPQEAPEELADAVTALLRRRLR